MNRCLNFEIFRIALLLVIFFGSTTNKILAKEESWLPISPEDLTLKDNPAYPGSSAMILYKQDCWDHKDKVRDLYYRIKIFRKEGRSYADIEIPYNSKTQELKEEDISARTIDPDGRIAEFRGVIFNKALVRTRKENLSAKIFSLPGIRDGSIVEYRYRIKSKKQENFFYTWFVQEDLFIREAHLLFRPVSSFKVIQRGAMNIASFSKKADDLFQVVLHDLAPFNDEVYSLPDITQQMRYYILYDWSSGSMDYEIKKYAKEYVEDFIGKEKDVRKITDQLIAKQDMEERKLRKLYAAVQERIRNLSYEEQYTKKERKREKLKERKSAKDVWDYKYGNATEITYLFTALCRAAGFVADTVLVTERDTNLFDSGIPLTYQIDSELVVVSIGSNQLYLDPGTRFAPFGWIPWWKQRVRGLHLGKDYSREIDVPSLDPEKNLGEHRITVELQPAGSALIEMKERYTGLEAVDFKNEFFDLSEEQKRHRLRERLYELFETADIKDVTWRGMDKHDEALEFSYIFHVPDCSVILNSRILIRPALWRIKNPFSQWERKLSVYLPDSYIHKQSVQILPPVGYEIEHKPEDSHYKTEFGEYEYQISNEYNLLRFRSNLIVQACILDLSEYEKVKLFFDRIEADEQRFILLRRQ